MPRNAPKTLKPVRPNAGIEIAYRKKIDALVKAMHASLTYWLTAAYRANEPELLAHDAPPDASGGTPIQRSPAMALRERMRQLTRQWQKRFDDASLDLAKYFATAVTERNDAALRSILKRSGFTVQFKLTRAMNDVLQATVGENVSLIKSIASQHLTQVEGLVMRSVTAGRDLESLAKELQEQFEVTKRRAARISLDQNNKATAALTRVRYVDLGIKTAKWRHSGGGKEPRPSHVKASREGVTYNIDEGWLDPAIGKRIWPGSEINCRCVSIPIVAGFS